MPATIIRSACRGVARKAPAPKRSRSKRLAPAAIISIAQQARPNVIGQMLDCRAQLIACSTVVVMTLLFETSFDPRLRHGLSSVFSLREVASKAAQRLATRWLPHGGPRCKALAAANFPVYPLNRWAEIDRRGCRPAGTPTV